jgi:probable DNA metabolism protein
MHRDSNERLLARAGRMKAAELEVSLQREDIRIKRMVNEVAGEMHRMKAFVRLSSLGPCVLYGYLKPRHKIAECICEHLARRNAGMIVVLGNGSESWISFFREGRTLRGRGRGLGESLERLESAMQIEDGGQDESCSEKLDVEGLWQAYYDSQYCPERKNLAAFHRHMPRRDQEAAGLRLVQNRRDTTLESFPGKS